jgi:hypothetical protein
MQPLDRAVLNCIAPYLTPDVIRDAIAEAVKRLGSRSAVAAERARIDRDLAENQLTIRQLVGFIKQGESEAVRQELAATEASRKELLATRDRLLAAESFRSDLTNVKARLTTILNDWADIRTKPIAQQRQLLRKLITERIVVTPTIKGDRKWVDWHGQMELAPIVSGVTPALGDVLANGPAVVAPTGHDRTCRIQVRDFIAR